MDSLLLLAMVTASTPAPVAIGEVRELALNGDILRASHACSKSKKNRIDTDNIVIEIRSITPEQGKSRIAKK